MKKTLQQISLTVALMTLCLSMSMVTGVSAEDRMDLVDSKRIEMEKVIDAYIRSREANSGMIDSRSESVRESAGLSRDKAEFCKTNRDQLVDELMAKGYEANPRKVYPFLNRRYFEAGPRGVYAHTH
jgi:hypothetical protein